MSALWQGGKYYWSHSHGFCDSLDIDQKNSIRRAGQLIDVVLLGQLVDVDELCLELEVNPLLGSRGCLVEPRRLGLPRPTDSFLLLVPDVAAACVLV